MGNWKMQGDACAYEGRAGVTLRTRRRDACRSARFRHPSPSPAPAALHRIKARFRQAAAE